MNALRARLAEAAPSIAVPFTDATSDEELHALQVDGLDIAEIRIDLFSTTEPDDVVAQVRRFAGLPTIATIRSTVEGGEWGGTEPERLALYRLIAPLVDGIDIEGSSEQIRGEVVSAAKEAGAVVVISHHDFEATPTLDQLRELASAARSAGADLVKVAATATETTDLQTLATFTMEAAPQGVIVLAMGSFGPASRVLLPCLGSRMTFAAGPQHEVVGQLSFEQTSEALRRFSPEFARRLSELDGRVAS